MRLSPPLECTRAQLECALSLAHFFEPPRLSACIRSLDGRGKRRESRSGTIGRESRSGNGGGGNRGALARSTMKNQRL